MAVQLSDLKPGDVVSYYHDNGLGGTLNYAKVVKIGAKMVKAYGEGQSAADAHWKHPHWFNAKVSDKTVAELRADGVKI